MSHSPIACEIPHALYVVYVFVQGTLNYNENSILTCGVHVPFHYLPIFLSTPGTGEVVLFFYDLLKVTHRGKPFQMCLFTFQGHDG